MCPLLSVQVEQADLNMAALYACNENLVPRDKCIFNFSIYFSSLDSVNGVSSSHPWLVLLVSEISLDIFSMTLRLHSVEINHPTTSETFLSYVDTERIETKGDQLSSLSCREATHSLIHPITKLSEADGCHCS